MCTPPPNLFYTVKPRPEAHMDMILFEVFLKSIDLIPQQQILQQQVFILYIMSLYYLKLWNQVDILQKHFKKDHVHMRLWTRFTVCERDTFQWFTAPTFRGYSSMRSEVIYCRWGDKTLYLKINNFSGEYHRKSSSLETLQFSANLLLSEISLIIY